MIDALKKKYDDFVLRMERGQSLFRVYHKDPDNVLPAIKAHVKLPWNMVDDEGNVIAKAGDIMEISYWARHGKKSKRVWYSGGVSAVGEWIYSKVKSLGVMKLVPKVEWENTRTQAYNGRFAPPSSHQTNTTDPTS